MEREVDQEKSVNIIRLLLYKKKSNLNKRKNNPHTLDNDFIDRPKDKFYSSLSWWIMSLGGFYLQEHRWFRVNNTTWKCPRKFVVDMPQMSPKFCMDDTWIPIPLKRRVIPVMWAAIQQRIPLTSTHEVIGKLLYNAC